MEYHTTHSSCLDCDISFACFFWLPAGRAKDKQFITNFGRQHEKTCGITDEKKVVKMKAKKNQDKGQQEETGYGISIVTKKENTKVETNDYDEDDVKF